MRSYGRPKQVIQVQRFRLLMRKGWTRCVSLAVNFQMRGQEQAEKKAVVNPPALAAHAVTAHYLLRAYMP